MKNNETALRHVLDRVIIIAVVLAWWTGTLGYYLLFQSAVEATWFIAKFGLFVAAFLAVGYSFLTFVLCVVLPVSHLWKALRRSGERDA